MNSPFCDKYFSRSKRVAQVAGLNPIVEYRIFTRFDGVAALEPMAKLIMKLSKDSETQVSILETGTEFKAKETIATIKGRFQDLVELETQYLQWAALPSYCAAKAKEIVEAAPEKIINDFAARHLYDPTSVALASYGAKIGGIPASSTDVGASAEEWLSITANSYVNWLKNPPHQLPQLGIGTTPHALLAIFNGDYLKMAEAYREAFPYDKFVALVDYNNREIDDTLRLLCKYDKLLAGVRIDTCGENYAQVGNDPVGKPLFAKEKGVSFEAVEALKRYLNGNGGEHVKLFVSSGFGPDKVRKFMEMCPKSFDGIGTGSFIPSGPTATSDIYMVDGKVETKVGREWGLEANKVFENKPTNLFISGE